MSDHPSAVTPYCAQELTAVSTTQIPGLATANLTPASRGQIEVSIATVPVSALQCFATQQLAIVRATGDPAVANLSDDQLRSYLAIQQDASPATGLTAPNATPGPGGGNYIVGIDSIDVHYKGSSLTWYGASKCSFSLSYVINNIGSAWNDKISSAVNYSYSGCLQWDHFPDANLKGNIQYGGYVNCGYGYGNGYECYEMGAMNDQTTSEQWTVR